MHELAEQARRAIQKAHGAVERVGNGLSLFRISALNAFVYFRYNKIMKPTTAPYAFFGLRKPDIDLTQGCDLYICFVTDDPESLFVVPFADFEACYNYAGTVADGHYKTTLFFGAQGVKLYIPKSGRFDAESYRGLDGILNLHQQSKSVPTLDHSGAQSLIGAIGGMKGHRIWFPKSDLDKIDRKIVNPSLICETLPSLGPHADPVFREIDVVWLDGTKPVALFEVEHSTPVYSGLLRISDMLITSGHSIESKIVAEQSRRDVFQRQIRRPTFSHHKLEKKVSFISYENVWQWHEKLRGKGQQKTLGNYPDKKPPGGLL